MGGGKFKSDPRLPEGWGVNWRVPHLKTGAGKLVKGWSKILEEIVDAKLDSKLVEFVRSGLRTEGWLTSELLPKDWVYKKYRHLIAGIPKDTLTICTNQGKIYRSYKKACDDHPDLSAHELNNIREWFSKARASFSDISAEEANLIQWSSDTTSVPKGWKYKCYSSFSSKKKETDKVHLYLSPEGKVLRGERLLREYLIHKDLYSNLSDQFPRLKNPIKPKPRIRIKKAGESNKKKVWSSSGEWREFDHPLLTGWKFKMLFNELPSCVHYMSPCGKLFKSRGPAIRFLLDERRVSYSQANYLKQMMKVRQAHTQQLKKNDTFLKSVPVTQNLLIFLKQRYQNSGAVEEKDPMFPPNWKKKIINGVEYIRNPEGNVFNSRKLATDHMRSSPGYCQAEILRLAMDDPESDDSELSDEEDDVVAVKLEEGKDTAEKEEDMDEEGDEGFGGDSKPETFTEESVYNRDDRRRSDSGQGASDFASESSLAARLAPNSSPEPLQSDNSVVAEEEEDLLEASLSIVYDNKSDSPILLSDDDTFSEFSVDDLEEDLEQCPARSTPVEEEYLEEEGGEQVPDDVVEVIEDDDVDLNGPVEDLDDEDEEEYLELEAVKQVPDNSTEVLDDIVEVVDESEDDLDDSVEVLDDENEVLEEEAKTDICHVKSENSAALGFHDFLRRNTYL